MPLSLIFDKWGRNLSLNITELSAPQSYKAFLQPLRYKNKMYLQGAYTGIGLSAQGYYLYIGPPEYDLNLAKSDGFITADNKKYQIDRCEYVYRGSSPWYVWAVLRSYEGE